ncbi:hypothetical protein, partial [Pseudoalteromonas sp. TAB23]|uniref:hypothetical protein n=1 Tax=Pseudoalteromonas sp. TAB23 TaxID=1938595 RepID=UPI001CD945D0
AVAMSIPGPSAPSRDFHTAFVVCINFSKYVCCVFFLSGSVDLSGLKFIQPRGDLIAARGL